MNGSVAVAEGLSEENLSLKWESALRAPKERMRKLTEDGIAQMARDQLARQNLLLLHAINLERRIAHWQFRFNRKERNKLNWGNPYAVGFYSAGMADSLAVMKGLRRILRAAGIHK